MNSFNYLNDPKYIDAIKSLYKVDKQGYLYHMDINYDYYNVPSSFMKIFDAGCSCFVSKNLEGENIMYRNYDYGHRIDNDPKKEQTGLNVILNCQNPNAKYKSICVADAYWLDHKNGTYIKGTPEDNKTDLSAFIVLPYLIMDGMNEEGLAVSILALPLESTWEEIPYENYESAKKDPKDDLYVLEKENELPDNKYIRAFDGLIAVNHQDKKAYKCHQETFETHKPNLPSVIHPILMRYMLDKCANTDEAISLTNYFNLKSVIPGSTYHIMITDKNGKTVLLEWLNEEMKVIDINHTTNFFVSREDRLGAGYDRDDVIVATLNRFKNGLREDLGLNTLALIAQSPENGADKGRTQYSCIYNTNKLDVDIYSYGDFKNSYKFKI